MKTLNNTLLAIFTIFLSTTTLQGQTNKESNINIFDLAQERQIEMPSLPWHLMQLIWNFSDSIIDFRRMDMEIIIDRDISTDYHLYICPFNGKFNGQAFYAGIQTKIDGYTTKEKSNAKSEPKQGGMKGGIFSRWSADQKTPIGLDYTEMFEDGLCESAGYEGEFCSVRRPFEWTKGSYVISLMKNETVNFKGEPHTWVSMEVTDKSQNKVTQIGRLLFKGEKLNWHTSNAAFVETYNFTPQAPHIPEAQITFKRPTIGDEKLFLSGMHTHQPVADKRQAGTNTPNCAYVTSEGTDITVYISSDVKHQTMNEIYNVIVPSITKGE